MDDLKRKQPMSSEQKNILIEFLRSHPEIKQKLSSNNTRQDVVNEWMKISNILNATPGTRKNWKEWRKV